MSSQKLKDFLNGLYRNEWTYKHWLERQSEEKIEAVIEPMGSQDWLQFSSKFVESINGSKVNVNTGLSDKEFLRQMKDGYVPNKEFDDDDDFLIY